MHAAYSLDASLYFHYPNSVKCAVQIYEAHYKVFSIFQLVPPLSTK